MDLAALLNARYAAWRNDVPLTWQAPLQNINPDLAGVPTGTNVAPSINVFPRLKADPLSGAAPGASTLRCLDRVKFDDVQVVILGQDPYPRKRQATGRSFEQGSWKKWDATSETDKVPASFRRVIQRLVEFRTGDTNYLTSWTKITNALASNTITLDSPTSLYDGWEDQKTIFLNKVLTYTLPAHVLTHHGVYWLPVVRGIVEKLAARSTGPVVFAMWGAEPARLTPFITNAATSANAWNTRVKVVTASHPATPSFLTGANPFKNINDALVSIGGTAPSW